MSPKVFLTGANGFVASHVLSGLVGRDYQVVASVRSEQKAQEILNLHPSWKSNVSFIYIPDVAAHDAFNKVFENQERGFDYVIHTASPVNFSVKDLQTELIDPAVHGTTNLIECAHKLGGNSIKRFVLLGSAVAVLNSFEDLTRAGKDYTEEDWNPVTAAYAIENKDVVAAYNVSKKLAEQATWQFMESAKPVFDLTVINPDIIIGPMIQPVPKPQSVNETNDFAVYSFFNGKYKQIEGLTFPFYHFVDVRDVALAHILALTSPAASNKRIVLVSGLITPQLVINTIQENFPELTSRVMEGEPSQILPKGVHPTGWNTTRSFEILGPDWSYIGLEKSLLDTIHSILVLEKQWRL